MGMVISVQVRQCDPNGFSLFFYYIIGISPCISCTRYTYVQNAKCHNLLFCCWTLSDLITCAVILAVDMQFSTSL